MNKINYKKSLKYKDSKRKKFYFLETLNKPFKILMRIGGYFNRPISSRRLLWYPASNFIPSVESNPIRGRVLIRMRSYKPLIANDELVK